MDLRVDDQHLAYPSYRSIRFTWDPLIAEIADSAQSSFQKGPAARRMWTRCSVHQVDFSDQRRPGLWRRDYSSCPKAGALIEGGSSDHCGCWASSTRSFVSTVVRCWLRSLHNDDIVILRLLMRLAVPYAGLSSSSASAKLQNPRLQHPSSPPSLDLKAADSSKKLMV